MAIKSISGSIHGINRINANVNKINNIDGNINIPSKVYVKELEFKNHYEFPSIGDVNILYVAIDENRIYRYDDSTHTYECVSSDYNEIDSIQCKLKEE